MSKQYTIAGRLITCPHCGHTGFEARKILLNTRGATFMNFDWLNRAAITLTCGNCGRIEWFQTEPRENTAALADVRSGTN